MKVTSTFSLPQQAQALARAIQEEMRFPVEPRSSDKTRLVKQLYDGVPERAALSFQEQDHKVAAKSELAPALANDEALLHLFCMVHGEFTCHAGVDIEHTVPYAKMRSKQAGLLSFLNAHPEFADPFLQTTGIENYFRRDIDSKIKGTGYFFKLCYNDIDNLILLCHACNIQKSDRDPLTWFEAQDIDFGKSFIEALEQAGGLREGVILSKIYHAKETDQSLYLGSGLVFIAHDGESLGLGQFIRRWFFDHFGEIFQAHKSHNQQCFEPFKAHVESIRELVVAKKPVEAHKAYRELLKKDAVLQQIYSSFFVLTQDSQVSTSGSDEEYDKNARKELNDPHV